MEGNLNPNDLRKQTAKAIVDCGIVPIIRAPNAELAVQAARALVKGGIPIVEVTMTTPSALEVIDTLTQELGQEVLVGVGSVLSVEVAEEAIRRGARFVVSPICRTELVPVAHESGCPTMIGAYSPTEAQLAHEAGSDFIKIFPADGLGPGYIRALLAPLPHLRIVPTGGVNLETLASFLKAGCVAVGVGSALVSKDVLQQEAWETLTLRARAFVAALRQTRETLRTAIQGEHAS